MEVNDNVPYILMGGKMEDALQHLPDNSVDAIVTDPPYGFKFMGKKWDYQVPTIEQWQQAYRVLKPGGYLLSFGGSRTFHRVTVNIEDAGFEIRDTIMWLYSQGFPKSHNLRKVFCSCNEKTKQNTEHDMRPVSSTNISEKVSIIETGREILQQELPKQGSQISGAKRAKRKIAGGEESSLEGRSNAIQKEGKLQGDYLSEGAKLDKTNGEEGWVHNGAQNDHGSNVREAYDTNGGGEPYRSQSIKQSSIEFGNVAEQCESQESRVGDICNGCGKHIIAPEYLGWGTALKPAYEPIIVARKPLDGTVAENVEQWGVGGINIDGCRVATDDVIPETSNQNIKNNAYKSDNSDRERDTVYKQHDGGRFPANVIHDGSDEVLAGFPDTKSGKPGTRRKAHETNAMAGRLNMTGEVETGYGDQGSAARFFYCAKATKSDRGEGNTHPTVKPTELMKYLVRLVTPKGGLVLDPFMGSGSTGKACMLEGFQFIGIDEDEACIEVARERISAVI